jgi:hypothetical protein
VRLREHAAGREELIERESRASRYGMGRRSHGVSIIASSPVSVLNTGAIRSLYPDLGSQ